MAIFVVIQGYPYKYSYISRIEDVSRLLLINKRKFGTNQIITNIVIEKEKVLVSERYMWEELERERRREYV